MHGHRPFQPQRSAHHLSLSVPKNLAIRHLPRLESAEKITWPPPSEKEGSEKPMKKTTSVVVLAFLSRSEEHTSELQSQSNLVCRLLLEKKKKNTNKIIS